MGAGNDRSGLRRVSGWGAWLIGAALLALAFVADPVPARAGVAANQLCGMAGLGAGCIGTFRPHGMSLGARPNVGGVMRGMGVRPNVGGMMGGVMGAIMGIVVEQMVDQMIQSAMEGAPEQEGASDLSGAVQDAVEKQVRFQQDRDRQLLAAMADVSASQLADGSSNMGLLESQAYQASLGFDRPLDAAGDALWMRVQDPWYSPESGGGSVPGARPLPVADSRLQYSVKDSDPLQCLQSLGGQLCAFPAPKGPALTLQPVPISAPAPPPPASVPAPAPGPVPVTTHTPPLLRTEIPTAPVASMWRPEEPAAAEPPCSAAIAFDSPDNLLAVARSEDPQASGGAFILNFTVGKLRGQLGQVQGKVASVMTQAYREFVRQLLCRNLTLLAAAPREAALGGGEAIAQADDIQAWAARGLVESGMKEYLSELKGLLKEKVDEIKGELKADARQAAEQAVSGQPGPPLDRDIPPYSGGAAANLRYREPWNMAGRIRHWIEESPHDHLLPGSEGPNAGALKD